MEPRFTGLRQYIRVTCLGTSAAEALLHDPTNGTDLLVPGHWKQWWTGSRENQLITVGGQPGHDIQLLEDGIDEEGPLIDFSRQIDERTWYVSVLNTLAKVTINGNATFPINGAAPYRLSDGAVVSVLNTRLRVEFRQVGDEPFPEAAIEAGAQKRKRDSASEESDNICVVCMTEPSVHAFIPCGHRCVCVGCSESIMDDDAKCPICRRPANVCTRIFCDSDAPRAPRAPRAPGGSGGSGGSGG